MSYKHVGKILHVHYTWTIIIYVPALCKSSNPRYYHKICIPFIIISGLSLQYCKKWEINVLLQRKCSNQGSTAQTVILVPLFDPLAKDIFSEISIKLDIGNSLGHRYIFRNTNILDIRNTISVLGKLALSAHSELKSAFRAKKCIPS